MPDLSSHPEYQALLGGVLESPEDDAPRLILADWLEEHGQDEYAATIRRQVRRPGPGRIFQPGRKFPPGYVAFPHGEWPKLRPLAWRRGFIGAITAATADFTAEAGEWFRWLPIEYVELSDVAAVSYYRRFVFCASVNPDAVRWEEDPGFSGPPWAIPPGIFAHMPRRCRGANFAVPIRQCFYTSHATQEQAVEDLSFACVQFGRAAAGLSPMPDPTKPLRVRK